VTPEEKTRIRILAGVAVVTTIAGGFIGYTIASKHKLGGTVVGILLAPLVSMPIGLLLAPAAAEPLTRRAAPK
jgi:hypothetical protein